MNQSGAKQALQPAPFVEEAEPPSTSWIPRRSPGATLTLPLAVHVWADVPEITHDRLVSASFFLSVTVHESPEPGGVPMKIRRFETLPPTGAGQR